MKPHFWLSWPVVARWAFEGGSKYRNKVAENMFSILTTENQSSSINSLAEELREQSIVHSKLLQVS